MSFIDTHCHMHFPDYEPDQAEALLRARQAGITHFINVGTDVPTSEASIRLARSHADIFATAGVHPHDAKLADPSVMKRMTELLQDPSVVAVGEIGLDFYRDHSPKDIQHDVLDQFLEMYRRVKKPLILHCRDAYEAMAAQLERSGLKPFCGVMHCYSSDAATMKIFLDLGFHISFAGPLTYKKNDALREACGACPKDRILLETDAPFLPPQSSRGKRNEPAFLPETAAAAALAHKISVREMGEITSRNAKALFGLS